jgi:membrane fusion protein, multidrug efflux system
MVSLGLCAGLAMVGCNRGQQPAMQMPPAPVVVATVATADVPVYLDEIGTTSATAVVTIEPQVSGKIIDRFFTDGSDVTVGQKLFAIDPRPFQAALDAALAAVEQAQAQDSNAKTDFDRVAGLLATKAVAQQDYDDKLNAEAVAKANVKAAQAQAETARLNLEYCTIVSPINGRAGKALVDPGNIANANSTALLNIQTIAPIYVDFTVPETELGRVQQNMAGGTLKVEVTSPDNPGHPETGDLEFFDNAVQDGTGTIKLRATVTNADRQLWPGQFVQVKLILKIAHGALLIPSEAVQIGQQGPFVFVVKSDNTAEQRQITPGQRQGEMVVVDGGLKAGESVVRTGQLMVLPGFPVMVMNPPTTQPAGAPVAAGATP